MYKNGSKFYLSVEVNFYEWQQLYQKVVAVQLEGSDKILVKNLVLPFFKCYYKIGLYFPLITISNNFRRTVLCHLSKAFKFEKISFAEKVLFVLYQRYMK